MLQVNLIYLISMSVAIIVVYSVAVRLGKRGLEKDSELHYMPAVYSVVFLIPYAVYGHILYDFLQGTSAVLQAKISLPVVIGYALAGHLTLFVLTLAINGFAVGISRKLIPATDKSTMSQLLYRWILIAGIILIMVLVLYPVVRGYAEGSIPYPEVPDYYRRD